MRFLMPFLALFVLAELGAANPPVSWPQGAVSWPQGTGPIGNFSVADVDTSTVDPPTQWSVVRDQSIRWRKPLPESGQSTVVSFGDRIFFTTMQAVQKDCTLGQSIVVWCCDSKAGKTIWTRKLAGDYPLRLSGCFSDSSSPPPLTDGQRVCLFNASGRIACFDFDGTLIWQNEMMPVGRTQPFMVGSNVVFIKQS